MCRQGPLALILIENYTRVHLCRRTRICVVSFTDSIRNASVLGRHDHPSSEVRSVREAVVRALRRPLPPLHDRESSPLFLKPCLTGLSDQWVAIAAESPG